MFLASVLVVLLSFVGEFLVSYGCVDAYITLLVAYIRVVVCVFVKYLFCLLFVGMYVNFGLLCMFRCLYSCVCVAYAYMVLMRLLSKYVFSSFFVVLRL